jgi:hypothetical protein
LFDVPDPVGGEVGADGFDEAEHLLLEPIRAVIGGDPGQAALRLEASEVASVGVSDHAQGTELLDDALVADAIALD